MTSLIKFCVRVVAALGNIAFWSTKERIASPGRDMHSEESLIAFFSSASNYADRNINEVRDVLGMWNDYEDWDRGRFIYDWVSGDLRARVWTQSQQVVAVEFYRSSGGKKRSGRPDEEVWVALSRE